MKRFWTKTINLILIVSVIVGYNQICLYNQKAEEAESLQVQLTDSQTMLKNTKNSLGSEKNSNENPSNSKDNVESKYKDGTYIGNGTGYGGTITVKVVISHGKINEISVVSADKEDKAYFDMAKKVIDKIKEKQSNHVDTVSGATFSSTGIIKAVGQALEKAEAK